MQLAKGVAAAAVRSRVRRMVEAELRARQLVHENDCLQFKAVIATIA